MHSALNPWLHRHYSATKIEHLSNHLIICEMRLLKIFVCTPLGPPTDPEIFRVYVVMVILSPIPAWGEVVITGRHVMWTGGGIAAALLSVWALGFTRMSLSTLKMGQQPYYYLRLPMSFHRAIWSRDLNRRGFVATLQCAGAWVLTRRSLSDWQGTAAVL